MPLRMEGRYKIGYTSLRSDYFAFHTGSDVVGRLETPASYSFKMLRCAADSP